MKRTNQFYILTNDPSLTAWGWAIINQLGKVVETGAIKTQPQSKKLRIRKGDDRVRRINELNTQLLKLFDKYHIALILSELPHGSQSASAAFMIGVVTGVMQTIGNCKNVSVEWFSEGDAKKSISGKRSLNKEEMISCVSKVYPEINWTRTMWRDEAIADAMAIYHVAKQQSELLKFINK